MAEIRFNYNEKFAQSSTNSGIGSASPEAKLDVIGNTSAESLRVSGIATLSSYQGFVNTKLTTNTDDLIVESGQSGSVSGEVVVSTGQTISVSTGATTGQGGVQSLKVYETFMPPVGRTADRPTDVKPGMVYYNKDFKTIEFWDGDFWKQVDNTTSRGLGIFHLGYDGSDLTRLEFVNISSQGNSINFGDLTQARRLLGAASSNTRGVFGGGQSGPAERDTIDYITMQSEGNAIDFGNLGSTRTIHQAFSSSTRAVWGGSYNAPGFSNVMEYVEIGTLGNALDFGDAVNSGYSSMAVSSPTRGILAGGYTSTWFSSIDFFTIASKGNGTNFGELTTERRGGARASNTVRGVFSGGAQGPGPAYVNRIDYVTIASAGNAVPFGDLTYSDTLYAGGTSSHTRGIIMGGYPENKNIDVIEIATTGNATDFGEVSFKAVYGVCGISDSHGGLGGF